VITFVLIKLRNIVLMNIKFFITILLTTALIQSCTLNMQLMSRDTGTMHNGSLKGFGGTGTLSVQIDEKRCEGSYAGSTDTSKGQMTIKALLPCSDGTGLRCELVGANFKGVGVCIDSDGRAFDVITN
jgi:hypothetical protein